MLKKTIRTILSFVVVVVLWQTACTLAHTNETLFPSPYKVLQAFIQLCTTGLPGSTSSVILPLHIETSLIRFAIGYFSSAVSAILLGLLLGSFPRVFTFINPILQIIRPIAPVAFMPFIVFWFGIGDVPAIVIIFIAGFFPILLSVVSAVQNVDKIYYKIADSFGVNKVKTLFCIIFPAIFTQISNALRLALGAYDIYNVTGWLSDVLSYSRLLALGLATGVIASVVNQMGSMLGDGILGAIGFIVVFIIGHTLNLAINLLGAYVHTNRLQFVEFFGKFYEGGGKPFNPFKLTTKYVDVKEETYL